MHKLIFEGFLGFMSIFALVHSDQSNVGEARSHEMTFTISAQNVYFDNDEIMVVINDRSFPVQSLQRMGDQWEVQVVSAGYCQMGHNLCGHCQLCHKRGCIYYIRNCKQWDPE
jgi:hypothetical protein